MKLNPKAIEGRKKRQYHNTPIEVLNEVHDGMTEGANKYGHMNWRETKIEFSDYYNSTKRHMDSWFLGEDLDPDSPDNVHHISKAITSLFVLRDAIIQGKFVDDRPKHAPAKN